MSISQELLKRGFIEELREMITILGAELPLDAFVKQSGIQDEQNILPGTKHWREKDDQLGS